MIELVTFRERPPALFLQQVLQERDIACELSEQQDTVRLLVEEADFERARLLVDEVAAEPYAERFSDAARRAGAMAARDSGLGVLADARGQRVGRVTWSVLVLCVVIFVLGGLQAPVLFELFPMIRTSDLPTVYQWLMPPVNGAMLAAEPWRMLTPVLLHFGLLHVLFNLYWWWLFGGLVERHHSAHTLVLLSLVTGLAGNAAQYQVAGPGFGGLSGVVCGLFGFLWLAGWVRGKREYRLPRQLVGLLLAWLVLSAVLMGDVVATAAHLGGLLAGCIYGALAGAWLRRRSGADGSV